VGRLEARYARRAMTITAATGLDVHSIVIAIAIAT
jgi:hypothetical protein